MTGDLIRDRAEIRSSWDFPDEYVSHVTNRLAGALQMPDVKAAVAVVLDETADLRELVADLRGVNAKLTAKAVDALPDDVMLAELVKRGVLTEAEAPVSSDMAGWYPRWDGNHEAEGRRFVTSWEVAP